MAEIKTKLTTVAPETFLETVKDEQKRADSLVLLKMFTKVTGEQPKMWGTSIVGYGQYHYKSQRSSQEGDWPLVGFSPRKQNLTLYIMVGNEHQNKLLNSLGKHKTAVSCLYIKKLADVNLEVLEKLIFVSYRYQKHYHEHV